MANNNHRLLDILKLDLGISSDDQDIILNQNLKAGEEALKLHCGEVDITKVDNQELVNVCIIVKAKALYFVGTKNAEDFTNVFDQNAKKLVYSLDSKTRETNDN